ncbi:DUF2878 domain-containing protein [Alteromonas sp. ASW11-19]|uniref:DUF2878 domain-containing protein n=1 Tax=Alteromonas salexigens TaxID=2982530 RepID=A0ABT2VQX2_9ALTE|nr:DUF2878 domain-containing protein [Alteromonas salexigens]MCU7554309.1 DUF2878 domain-containing protein [Alteromonas salexigens]
MPEMTATSCRQLVNFIWFQTIWLLVIFFQYEYLWVVGLLLFAFFVVCHEPRRDGVLVILLALLGLTTDSVLTIAGVFEFPAPEYGLLIPWWLVALWAAFAATLRHSLRYFRSRWLLAILGGAVFGPVSYAAGARLGAVAFGYELTTTLLILASVWAVVFPLSVWLSQWVESTAMINRLSSKT